MQGVCCCVLVLVVSEQCAGFAVARVCGSDIAAGGGGGGLGFIIVNSPNVVDQGAKLSAVAIVP